MVDINPQIIEAEIAQIGPQGIPGQAATISIGSVTTGAAGSSATVTNSGTPNAAVLDFVIPQGAKGAQGEQGQQGIQGLTGATGNGISSIAKIGTSGLVDTYRISLTDNTHYDFTVTNGSSISDIEKTGTSGLVDTYTITLTNGNTHTFTVTNGAEGEKGETGDVGNGILNILKMSTTGLVDNYRINFTNGTYFDFDVTNALSIQSIAKLSTSGLVDTYRITFNDNTYFDFPVTNGKGVTGVTLLSWEGLDKTYRMSFNDGSYFDYVVTNGTGQVDWGGISGILSQQIDLQDALVQSNGLTTGSVSTYNVMLDELIERAHSTFDKSKFTVVGSPIVTDDGIASGLSSADYFQTPDINFSNASSFEVLSPIFSISEAPASTVTIFGYNGGTGNPLLYVNIQGTTLDMKLAFAAWTDYIGNTVTITTGKSYQVKYVFTGTQYEFYYREVGSDWVSVMTPVSRTDVPQINNVFNVGYRLANGTLDLKELYVKIDGVEVFSGNKTGIDTIKPDDYTVIGTPTISADGVASGFSSSNYLTYSALTSLTTTFTVKGSFETSSTTTEGTIWATGGNSYHNSTRIFFANNILRFTVDYNGTTTTAASPALATSTKYDFITTQSIDGKLSLKWRVVGSETWSEATANGTLINCTSVTRQRIGQPIHNTEEPFLGSIDLNAFKIYVDGNLVYQPCLKIPYTQSKTGAKIVSSSYRDRVNDMAEQFGYANYYTLDEDNGNFTLPMGELYGLIGDKTLRDSYYNGVTYWELFSNRRLEQGGTCDSGVEYTLPKPFADANYVLTIPYSSKTATSFIPSATGDFIAKGMGLL